MRQDDSYVLKLNKYEYGIIYHALNDKRNDLLNKNEPTNGVDDVLLKVIQINEKRNSKNDKAR